MHIYAGVHAQYIFTLHVTHVLLLICHFLNISIYYFVKKYFLNHVFISTWMYDLLHHQCSGSKTKSTPEGGEPKVPTEALRVPKLNKQRWLGPEDSREKKWENSQKSMLIKIDSDGQAESGRAKPGRVGLSNTDITRNQYSSTWKSGGDETLFPRSIILKSCALLTNQWNHESMNQRIHASMDQRIVESLNRWTDIRWIDESTNRPIDGCSVGS